MSHTLETNTATMTEQADDKQFLSKKPSLDELRKHVRVIKMWYKFGELLHLHTDKLDAIEELYQDSDANFKTLKMFYLWLDT